MPRDIITRTEEYLRICDLPRRRIDPKVAEALAAKLTPKYCTGDASLTKWQALAIHECALTGTGATLGYPVGTGKTLVFELAPIECKAERPLLLLPSPALADKTYVERAGYLEAGFRLRDEPIPILTKKQLGVESYADILERMQPDFIGIDECDEWADVGSAASLRLGRYITKRREAGLPLWVLAASGSLVRKSMLDIWHILGWTLDGNSPFPLDGREAERWAHCVDLQPRGARGGSFARPLPGVLGATREIALEWISTRLLETPGVITLDEDSAAGIPLTIRQRLPRECELIDGAFEAFLRTGATPSGLLCGDPLSRFRKDAEIGCGIDLYWDPQPPPEWREAFNACARYTLAVIQRGTRVKGKYLDSEGQVIRAFPEHPVVREWVEIKPTFKPNTRCKWISSTVLESCIDWLDELELDGERGVIWTGSTDFMHALKDLTQLPAYGPGGKEIHTGSALTSADPSEHMISSWHANMKGFNLQAWPRMLVVFPPPSAKWLEQLLGRSHRMHQRKPVIVDVMMTSGATFNWFESSLDEESGFGKALVKMTQKYRRADIVRVDPPRTTTNDARWTRASDQRYGAD